MLARTAENFFEFDSRHACAFYVMRSLGIEQAKNAFPLRFFGLRSQRGLGLVKDFPVQLPGGMIASIIFGASLRITQNLCRGSDPNEHFRIACVGGIGMIALCQNAMDPMDGIRAGLRAQLHDFVTIQLFWIFGEGGGIARWRIRLPPFTFCARPLAVLQFQPDLISASSFCDAPLDVGLQLN